MSTGKIKGGYYLKAKRFQESWIAKAPPHVREIWDLFLRKAFYKDMNNLKRGQLIITYSEIIEELAWFIGYRKMTYKKHHCEIAMKALVKATMITTTKTTRGVIVTILNYDKYQDVKNYECYTKDDTNTTGTLQCTATIEKEVKEVKDKSIVGTKKNGVPYSEIVSFLNEKTERDFKPTTKATQGYIKARWEEGFVLEDFKKVIQRKADEWLDDNEMSKFLRPETLFGKKFESYLVDAKKRGQSEWR